MQIKKILGYYWPHIKKHKWVTLLTFVAYGIATILSEIFTPLLYKKLIDLMTAPAGAGTIDHAVIIGLVLFWGVLLLMYNIFYRIGDFAIVYAQSKVLKSTIDEAFARLQDHSIEFFNNNFAGSLVAKIRRFSASIETIYDTIVFHIWMNGISLIGVFIVLAYLAPILAGLFIVWLATYITIITWFIRKKMAMDLQYASAQSTTTGQLADALGNVLNIKMFSSSIKEIAGFKKVTNNEEEKRYTAWRFHMLQNLVAALFVAIFEFISIFIAVKLWINGEITIGTIVLIQTFMFALFKIVWNMGKSATRFIRALTDAKEIIDIFETPVGVVDVDSPEVCKITKGEIDVRDISFSYNSGDRVFNNFSMHIDAGERVGLVGYSGSGKTTITKLLLRFIDVDSGEILIDGQDIAKIKQDDLRRNISYVPQDPVLFHRSLRENIAYGKSDATEEEIVEAAKAANAHDFISALPEGYDTLVGERGVKLSGGERQRVAIARAMLKDAPILILDEATSALDSISERHIQQAFERLMQGRTTLAIAHRLSTIQKMDRIVVFDKGAIVEQGTHQELIKQKDGVYAELWAEQSSGFIE
jgi:ATP-binding cassette subfamily B protein